MAADYSRLAGLKQSMPAFVAQALKQRRLMEACRMRPAYQQNDYLGWINRAKHQETTQKRLFPMRDEL